ncbi:hypothetical protein [Marinimicrococcus flavescens]|uniref:Uncharacterized protein n=1 Tax=Marinimicrococcus flavescens TaxID=3031815 RepID=A0AAP3UZ15_9PROT|nr:hypothetical protein [Marinimicrococcus flavescens]
MSRWRLPDWLVAMTTRFLLGEIYPDIVAIALSFTEDNILTIRYYVDREPNDEDYESMSELDTNIEASLPLGFLKAVNLECIRAKGRANTLDPLDGFVYLKYLP